MDAVGAVGTQELGTLFPQSWGMHSMPFKICAGDLGGREDLGGRKDLEGRLKRTVPESWFSRPGRKEKEWG